MSPAPGASGGGQDREAATFDGVGVDDLRIRLGLPRLEVYASVGSTMDVAHALAAAGAPTGATVLADRQEAGRGRQGRAWHSASGQGVWVTVIARPHDPGAVEVLSLRIGLAIAGALDPLAPSSVRVKWPNDLHVDDGKLAGILVEARWRDARLDWVAIGIGLNVRPPAAVAAGALRPGTSRIDALACILPAVRVACDARGHLSPGEVAAFQARDLAVGRHVVAPAAGIVRGIDGTGAIVISTSRGEQRCRSGSLQFAEAV